MGFWRRSKGRHERGAVSPRPVGEPSVAAYAVPPPVVQASAVAPDPVRSSLPMDWAFPELPPPAAASGPRVELTFRDGTSAALEGQQARALDEIAQVLTRRD